MPDFVLKARLRPNVRQLLLDRRKELQTEIDQIDDMIRQDDAHTLVGMPAFNVGGKRRRQRLHLRS